MIIKKELIKRAVGNETVLIPVGRTLLENNGLFMMNELASFIWDLLPGAETEEDILRAVLAEYEVSEQKARKDIGLFLDKLRKLDII